MLEPTDCTQRWTTWELQKGRPNHLEGLLVAGCGRVHKFNLLYVSEWDTNYWSKTRGRSKWRRVVHLICLNELQNLALPSFSAMVCCLPTTIYFDEPTPIIHIISVNWIFFYQFSDKYDSVSFTFRRKPARCGFSSKEMWLNRGVS